MGSSSYNYIKLEHFVPFEQEEFESGKLKLITRYKSDVKFSLKNSNVTKIKIPKNLVNLEPGCFSGCQHLQSIEVDVQNPNLRMEDTILVAFLDLIGFDIVFFVPTGYQSVERYFAKEMIEEHQAGEFMYDLRIPDMNSISANAKRRLRDKFFKRGK